MDNEEPAPVHADEAGLADSEGSEEGEFPFEDDEEEDEEDDEEMLEYSVEDDDFDDEEDEYLGGGDGVSESAVNAAAVGDAVDERPPPAITCCVCLEPWTSEGPHRICCIPCGHVYGRCCLERWLRRCGNRSARCPQCSKRFKQKHIINLYATEYLWNDCSHREEIAEIQSLVDRRGREWKERLDQVERVVEDQMAIMKSKLILLKERMKRMNDQMASPLELIDYMVQNWPEPPSNA